MQLEFVFEASDNKKYEVDNVWDNGIYTRNLVE